MIMISYSVTSFFISMASPLFGLKAILPYKVIPSTSWNFDGFRLQCRLETIVFPLKNCFLHSPIFFDALTLVKIIHKKVAHLYQRLYFTKQGGYDKNYFLKRPPKSPPIPPLFLLLPMTISATSSNTLPSPSASIRLMIKLWFCCG